ncbi:glycosyltransferase [Azohydromonas caseinilytica]|uniref:Glycosyltransferase family 1 protein n=1 Tax=Azohydromonas caseinilytica TaxID=2728836 RepID=A0A848FE51_9BURK|nr:glycosyltransferase [Azohydromonas caseinilytica]NML16649.1 glycosyltransferase family 1 protein [Azohydromonas caseinilytica]
MPPHYLLATAGSHGDMHPFMSLAQVLQGMGREVRLMGPAFHDDLVRPTGIPFIGMGSDEDVLRVLANPDVWHPRKGLRVLFQNYRERILSSLPAVMAIRPAAPLVVISHPLALPTFAIAREKGWPARLVAAYLAPSNLRTVHDPLVIGHVPIARWVPLPARRALWALLDRTAIDPLIGAEVNAARAVLGLPQVGRYVAHLQEAPELSVTLFPAWFAPPQPDWPRPLLMGEFPLYDATAGAPWPAELAAFMAAGPAPLVVTPGTGNAHAAHLFKAAAEAAQRLRLRAVFLTRHREQVPARLPGTILWQPYVPLAMLLPHTAALVHHGGIGTTAEALRAGVPQLVTPFAWDQFDNAARVEALGMGVTLPAARVNTRRLTAALRPLCAAEAVTARGRQVAARFAQARGPEALCRDIEAALGLAA